jgi:anti-sigma-K factor RskA
MFDATLPTGAAGRESARRSGNAELWRAIAGMSLAAMIATVMVAIEFTRNLSGEVAYHGRVADELARRNHSLKHQLALSQRKLELAETSDSETRANLTRILLSADAKAVRLGPTPMQPGANAPQARGLVIISAKTNGAAMHVSGLPQLPAGRVYELWWIGAKGGPVSAGLFRPGPRGEASMTTTLPPAGDELLASAVTIEPDGGVPKPTGPTVLKGQANATKLSRSLASRLDD